MLPYSWQPGHAVVWDNRRFLHSTTPVRILRHRLCLVLPLPSRARHCLCLAVLHSTTYVRNSRWRSNQRPHMHCCHSIATRSGPLQIVLIMACLHTGVAPARI